MGGDAKRCLFMTGTFFQSAAILLREGLEALLVIAALAAYLRKAGACGRLAALYGGAGAAIIASIFAAWLFEVFNKGAHSDLMEAGIILCAAVLMLYVSGWLILRQDPRAWQGFLKSKAEEALAKQTGIAVALLAFLAVFREGAESVLFVHTLAATSGGWSPELVAGLLAGGGRARRAVRRHQLHRREAAAASALCGHIGVPVLHGRQVYRSGDSGVAGAADRAVQRTEAR